MARKKRTNPKGNKQIKPQQPSFAGKAIKLIVIVILILGMLFGAGYCTWRYWLKDYMNIDGIEPADYIHRMTMSGSKVVC